MDEIQKEAPSRQERFVTGFIIKGVERDKKFLDLTPEKQEETRQAIRDHYRKYGIRGSLQDKHLDELEIRFKEIRERGGG